MDKVKGSAQEAIADLQDGASVIIAGFGVGHRWPTTLVRALRDKGSKNLTVICNLLGSGELSPQILAENRQISKLIASFSTLAGYHTPIVDQIKNGEVEFELVPQGTLVERLRAGGAGIGAFYTRTGVGTQVAEGKEIREFNGVPHVLETAITADFSFVRAQKADRMGNLHFRGGSRNFNDSFAKAGRIAIAEVDEIVDVLAPEEISLPGIFVDRVVQVPEENRVDFRELAAARRAAAKPTDEPRLYLNKPGISREIMALKAALRLQEGSYVNLGIGIPTLISNFIFDRDIILHSENGILNYGPIVALEEADPDLYNAGGQLVSQRPGISFFDSVTAFEMARGGHLDMVILGGFQVSAKGDLANWTTPEMVGGGIGGAMDLVAGGSPVMVLMEHCDRHGNPKILERCTYPLTGVECVKTIITDLAVIEVTPEGLVLEELAPGFTPEEIQSLTGARLMISDNLTEM